jgi:hypothetical protein
MHPTHIKIKIHVDTGFKSILIISSQNAIVDAGTGTTFTVSID